MDENQQQQPQQQQPQQQPQFVGCQPIVPLRQRRVGTFTLGLTLILIGVIIPLTMIFKDRAVYILKFAPIVLVILGIEVLIYAFRFKDGKLKYDGFSIFLVIIITLVSVTTASIAPLVSNYVKFERVVRNEYGVVNRNFQMALKMNDLNGDFSIYSTDIHGNSVYDSWWYDSINTDEMLFKVEMDIRWKTKSDDAIPTQEEIETKLSAFIKDIGYKFERLDIQVTYDGVRIADIAYDKASLETGNVSFYYDDENVESIIKEQEQRKQEQENISSEVQTEL